MRTGEKQFTEDLEFTSLHALHLYLKLFVALAIKGIDFEIKPIHLLKDGGQQVCIAIK